MYQGNRQGGVPPHTNYQQQPTSHHQSAKKQQMLHAANSSASRERPTTNKQHYATLSSQQNLHANNSHQIVQAMGKTVTPPSAQAVRKSNVASANQMSAIQKTRQTPNVQRKVNNLLRNIETSARVSSKQTTTAGAMNSTRKHLGNSSTNLPSQASTLRQARVDQDSGPSKVGTASRNALQKKQATQAQQRVASKASANAAYGPPHGAQTTRAGLKTMLSPHRPSINARNQKPPQQNTRIKFHKPELDLFSKKSDMSRGVASPLTDGAMSDINSQSPKPMRVNSQATKGYILSPQPNHEAPMIASPLHPSQQRAATSNQVATGSRKSGMPDNFSFVDRKFQQYVQGSFSPPPLGGTIGSARATLGQRGSGTGSGRGVSSGENWRQNRAPHHDAGGSASGYFSYNPAGAESTKNTQSAANLKLSAMAGYGSRPPVQAQYGSTTQSAAYLQEHGAKDRGKTRGSTSRTRGSPLAHGQYERPSPSAAAVSPTSVSGKPGSEYQTQSQRTRIQKAPMTANVLPQARLVQQQSKIISQNVQNITAALSKTSHEKAARASKKGEHLLNTGMNRRIEGIAGGNGFNPMNNRNDPFDFNVGNVKDDDEQMNLNSVEEGRMMRISSTVLQKQAETTIGDYNSAGNHFAEQVSSRSGKDIGLVSNFGNGISGAQLERAAHTAHQSRLHHFQAQAADKGYTSMAARQKQMLSAQRRDRSARIIQRAASKAASRAGNATQSNIEDSSYATGSNYNRNMHRAGRTGNETTQLMSLGEEPAFMDEHGQPLARHEIMSEENARRIQQINDDDFGDCPREEQVDELVVEDLFQKKKIMSASVASIAGMSNLGLHNSAQPGASTRRRQVGLSPSTVTVEQAADGYGTHRAPVLITNDNNFKKKFGALGGNEMRHTTHLQTASKNVHTPHGQKINYIARNIKRVGVVSKEKHQPVVRTHRGEQRSTNFDGTGMANAADQPVNVITSPRTHRGEPPKHLTGSMATLGSPSSPGVHGHGAASKKTQRKLRLNKDKEAQNSQSSNLFGQTGTTGGTAPFHPGQGTTSSNLLSPQPNSRQNAVLKSYREQVSSDRSLTDKYISVLSRQGAGQASGNDSQRKQTLQTALSKSTQNFQPAVYQSPATGQPVERRKKPMQQAAAPLQDRVNQALEMRNGNIANKVGVTQAAKRAAQKAAPYAGGQLNTVRLAEHSKTPTLNVEIPAALSNSASKKSAGQSQTSSMKATIVSSQKLATQRNPLQSNKTAQLQKKAPVPTRQNTREKTSKLRAPNGASRQNFMSQPASGSRKINKLSSLSATGTDDARDPNSGVGDGSSYNQRPAPDGIMLDEIDIDASHSRRIPQNYLSSSREDFRSVEPAPRTGSPDLLPMDLDNVNAIANPQLSQARSAQRKQAARPGSTDKNAGKPRQNTAAAYQATENKKKKLREALNEKGYAADLVGSVGKSPKKKTKTTTSNALQKPVVVTKQKRTRNVMGGQQDSRFNDDRNFLNSSRYVDELEHSRAASRQGGQTPARLDESIITTESENERYALFAQNMTSQGMIQSTIYHIRHEGANVYDPQEKSKYYSEEFLMYQRHVNDKVEQELEEFKVEIDEKVAENTSKFYVFPRPCGRAIYTNTEENRISNVTDSRQRSSVLGGAEDTEEEAQPQEYQSDPNDSDAYLTPRNAKQAANDYGNQSLTDLLGDDGRGVLAAGAGPNNQVKAASRAPKGNMNVRNKNQVEQQMPSSTGRRAMQATGVRAHADDDDLLAADFDDGVPGGDLVLL